MKRIKFEFNKQTYEACYSNNIHWFTTRLEKILSKKKKIVGIDLETGKNLPNHPKSGLDPHTSFIRLIQLFDGEELFIFDTCKAEGSKLVDQFDLVMHKPVWEKFLKTQTLVAHNAIFEIKHLWHNYVAPRDIHCSMLMASFINNAEYSPFEPAEEDEFGNEVPKYNRSVSLAACMDNHFGLRVPKIHQTSNWNAPELSKEQLVYAGIDAIATYLLAKKFIKKINKYKLQKSYTLYKRMMHVIAEMELNGFKIDIERHKKLIKDWEKERDRAEKDCRKYFGNVNLRSNKQMHNWVLRTYNHDKQMLARWPKTDKGMYSFNKQAISSIESPAIDALLTYKKYATLLSTFGESLLKKLSPATKRLHGSFSLGETRTGRLSSREPNLQNMPARDGSFRHIFVAEKGYKLVVADFSQIEIRVAGELSRDPEILRAYQDEKDLHSEIVRDLTGQKKVSKSERQLGKAINFGLQFGMGPSKLAHYAKASYGVELSEADAKAAYNLYHSKYLHYSKWCDVQREKCDAIGYVRTPLGRMRKLLPSEVYTKAVNTPVQGGAAEVSFASLIYLQNLIRQSGYSSSDIKIICTVHDEIVLEVKEEYVEQAQDMLELAMQEGMIAIFPKATRKGLVESNHGHDWSEAK